MTWFLILKFLAIIFFLIMFLRRPSIVWGVGLLTVTSAVLLDTLLGTFDRQALQAEMGFFYFILAGSLFAGAAFWLWGLLLPLIRPQQVAITGSRAPQEIVLPGSIAAGSASGSHRGFVDRQMVYEEIKERFDYEDILDLIFDLEINENEVKTLDQDMNQLIINVINVAEAQGKSDDLSLAVERILTPPPTDHLPRLERLNAESPPTILRHYLLANYSLTNLRQLAEAMQIDWEQLDRGAKREKTRSLLQYVYRRNRVAELIDLLQNGESESRADST
jgi:hypothetical protein